MKLSDHDIDEFLELVEHSYNNNSKFKGDLRKRYMLEDLKHYLKQKSSGVRENVCPHCLGSGYKE